MSTKKVLILETTYEKIFNDIKSVFEEFDLDLKGKNVFLKPNILVAVPQEKGVTTHPSVVEATVKYLKGRGANVVVGDNSGMRTSYGNNENVAKACGIYQSSLGNYVNIARSGTRVKISLKEYPEVTISKAVYDCDFFISMPKFKTHLNTIISGAIKNSYGLVVGAEKMMLHAAFPDYAGFARAIVEVFKTRPPDLIIMDAITGMEGDGPHSPNLREINKIIASADPVAIDSVMCYMMGIDPKKVNTLQIAKDELLGESDINNLAITGKLEKIPDFKPPVTLINQATKDSIVERVLTRIVGTGKLRVEPRYCTVCKQCYENCPVKAIRLDKYPVIDTKKCILCFCCKEVCPKQAIRIGGLFGNLLRIFRKR